MDLLEVAEELYGLVPAEFTNARNESAKQAKADGEAHLAADIKELRKPSTAAWVVNMLMRHQADQMEQVLSLGASLREAQDDMDADALRQLTKQRRQLTAVVTHQGTALAKELGHRVSDAVATQVQETLHAAMVDEHATAAVRTGMLVEALSATGVGELDVTAAVAVPSAIGTVTPRPKKAAKKKAAPKRALKAVEDDTRALEEAKRKVKWAEVESAKAKKLVDQANQRVSKLEARSMQLHAELDELRRKASELEHRLEVLDDELGAAEEDRDETQHTHADARAFAEEARAALAKLQR